MAALEWFPQPECDGEGDGARANPTAVGLSQELKNKTRASLAAQWWRIHLPMQGTWINQSLIWEDLTSCGTTKPMHHSYSAWAPEPVLHNRRGQRSEKPVRYD